MGEVFTEDQIQLQIQSNFRAVVGFYCADAAVNEQVKTVMKMLAEDMGGSLHYVFIQLLPSDLHGHLRTKYSIKKTPTILFFTNGSPVSRFDGYNIPELCTKVRTFSSEAVPHHTDSCDDAAPHDTEALCYQRIRQYISEHPVMLFMKGQKVAPFCRFSKQAVHLLNTLGVQFDSFDVFQDEAIRQHLKTFSDWPTFPQLYVNGEFVGGVDILTEMFHDGSLHTLLERYITPKETHNDFTGQT